jgi:hypothetical protein
MAIVVNSPDHWSIEQLLKKRDRTLRIIHNERNVA